MTDLELCMLSMCFCEVIFFVFFCFLSCNDAFYGNIFGLLPMFVKNVIAIWCIVVKFTSASEEGQLKLSFPICACPLWHVAIA